MNTSDIISAYNASLISKTEARKLLATLAPSNNWQDDNETPAPTTQS